MSKITFRADDDLVERLEACDASKSEVMREALRTHLDDAEEATAPDAGPTAEETVGAALADRVDDLIAERLDAALDDRLGGRRAPSDATYASGNPAEVNVNVSLDAPDADAADTRVTRETSADAETETRKTPASANAGENACGGCGENVPEEHVYCPNCGEKQSHRAFCECGDELRTDWAFCPGCGRRTPAADVLNDR
ncbi:CopG family transcriptional regulator [Halorubrum sp. Ib24]|uniref:double zinc ribbon domain-containing protein n=1 Tax=unclassified Halorubrum TaxID=2642239 RepID=UPI000B97E9F0|nr:MULTISPECIES: ribbon-helix-helix protein, CopG family [unclassified Halorubrum]OYR38596.1 CopG family transcriptional regulator [Halorubrum sp. Hd13]OYR39321.1 CopG family transcriptional regulator [Halorubrum sp. Ib24]OYR42424.1 CopG family transcriptional regulator [Halorubrum sp. Eb13]OYR44407.1 CopG family transcriptional regulator [Halorubrum sp. Ea8]OYR52221.1 CopG family transcriptional regulator [Halorubrum sp. Ea1]